VEGSIQQRHPFRLFAGVSSFQVLAMFRRGLFYAYLSLYLRFYLGLSVTETTLFATFPMVLNILCQTFVWGKISDKYQLRRTLIIWGEVLAAFGTTLVWFLHIQTDNHYVAGFVIIIGLSLVEIFWSMSNIGWSALISDLYPMHQRRAIQGKLSSVGGIGRILGVWTGGLFYDGLGIYYDGWGFQSGTLFFTASGVMLLSVIPLRYLPEGGCSLSQSKNADETGSSSVSSTYLFYVFLAAMILINFGRNSIVIIQSQYLFLESGFAVSSRVLSYIVNTESVAIIIVGLLAGRIGKRIGNGKTVCLGASASLVFLLIFAATMDLRLAYAGAFLKGAGEVIIYASGYGFASVLIPPEKRGRLFSLFNATFFLSWGIAGTLIAAPIVDSLISAGFEAVFAYKMGYWSAVVLTIAGLLLQLLLVFVLIPRSALGKALTSGL
jgi:MFS family permease